MSWTLACRAATALRQEFPSAVVGTAWAGATAGYCVEVAEPRGEDAFSFTTLRQFDAARRWCLTRRLARAHGAR